MKLVVTTPLAIVVEVEDIRHLRAEDESGSFGIRPGHADFLTALAVSVLTWRDGAGGEHHVAVRGGVLEVQDGRTVAVASREAVAGDDLQWLEKEVLTSFHRRLEEERAARIDSHRLYLNAIRQIYRYLRPEAAAGGGPPLSGPRAGASQ